MQKVYERKLIQDMKQEENLQIAVCNYLRLQYPSVIFTCDLASGMRLTIGQAVKAKKMRSSRGYPDLFIAQPTQGKCGLFIELKKSGTKLMNRKGEQATPHILEQETMLVNLSQLGYVAMFAIGFNEAKKIIDAYLK